MRVDDAAAEEIDRDVRPGLRPHAQEAAKAALGEERSIAIDCVSVEAEPEAIEMQPSEDAWRLDPRSERLELEDERSLLPPEGYGVRRAFRLPPEHATRARVIGKIAGATAVQLQCQLCGFLTKPPDLLDVSGEHRRMVPLEERAEERDRGLHGRRKMAGGLLPFSICVPLVGIIEERIERELAITSPRLLAARWWHGRSP